MQDYDTIEGDAGPCKYRVSLSIGRTKKINTYGMAGQKLKTSADRHCKPGRSELGEHAP